MDKSNGEYEPVEEAVPHSSDLSEAEPDARSDSDAGQLPDDGLSSGTGPLPDQSQSEPSPTPRSELQGVGWVTLPSTSRREAISGEPSGQEGASQLEGQAGGPGGVPAGPGAPSAPGAPGVYGPSYPGYGPSYPGYGPSYPGYPYGPGLSSGPGGPGGPSFPGGPGGPSFPGGPSDSGGDAGPPKRRRTRLVVASVAAAIVLIGSGAGIAEAISSNNPGPVVRSSTVNNTSPPAGTTLHTAAIAAKVNPAVVDINTVVELPGGHAQAAGTGMIVSSNGYVVTNNHVVEDATSIQVSIHDRPGRYSATFVGADPVADVAVIRVHGLSSLPTVSFGDSKTLAVGDPVVAIGNALGLGGSPTVSTGIVSALDRSINASDSAGPSEHLTGLIQTDAPIEPGNSGGPLVDAAGHVIGMDTAAASAGNTGSSLGFALPINRVAAIASQIEAGKHVHGVVLGLQAFLGVDVQNATLIGNGAKHAANVVAVVPGTPADRAGIGAGDVILKFNGTPTPTSQALSAAIKALKPGDSATVTFESQTGTETVHVTLVAGPAA